jgi:hypothetical protein
MGVKQALPDLVQPGLRGLPDMKKYGSGVSTKVEWEGKEVYPLIYFIYAGHTGPL